MQLRRVHGERLGDASPEGGRRHATLLRGILRPRRQQVLQVMDLEV